MYAKVFAQIFDSSLVERPDVRFTFMDLLVLADPNGVVDMTHNAIARRTNRPIEVIRATIAELESPDPSSRTPDAEGARLKRLDTHRDWGWIIINFDRFHKLASEEQRRERTRQRVADFRAKTRMKRQVTPRNDAKRMKRHIDIDVDIDTDVKQPSAANNAAGSSAPPERKKRQHREKPDDDAPPPPFRQFTDEYCRLWERAHGAVYPFQRKDGVAAAAIWNYAKADLRTAVEIGERYLLETSAFYAGHPLTKLAADLPRFAAVDAEGIGDPFKAGGREPTPAELALLADIPPNG